MEYCTMFTQDNFIVNASNGALVNNSALLPGQTVQLPGQTVDIMTVPEGLKLYPGPMPTTLGKGQQIGQMTGTWASGGLGAVRLNVWWFDNCEIDKSGLSDLLVPSATPGPTPPRTPTPPPAPTPLPKEHGSCASLGDCAD